MPRPGTPCTIPGLQVGSYYLPPDQAGLPGVGELPGANSLNKRGVNVEADRALLPPCRATVSVRLREPPAGTTVQTLPGTRGHLRTLFPQVKRMKPTP